MELNKPGRIDQSDTEWSSAQTMFLTKKAPIDLPLNLGDWMEREKVMGWVLEEVDTLDQTDHIVKATLATKVEPRPRTMLALLALAYCTQVFRSTEVVQACHTEPVFRQVCGGQPPFEGEIEHFRRTHRAAVERVIAQVLLRAVREKFHFQPNEVPPGLEKNMHFRAEQRTDMARHLSNE
jgi:hypothetical protein